jgi:hypothetical protein
VRIDPSGNVFCGDFSHSLTTTSHQRSLWVCLSRNQCFFKFELLNSYFFDRRKFVLPLRLHRWPDVDRGLGSRTVKASLLVFFALIAFAPILRTLTAPTSADSISALMAALVLVNATSPIRCERCVCFLLFWWKSKAHRVGKDCPRCSRSTL